MRLPKTASHEARDKISRKADVGRVTFHPTPSDQFSPTVGHSRAMSGPHPNRRQ